MKYEGDENKRDANLIMHGVDFSDPERFEWESALETITMKRKPKNRRQEDWDALDSSPLSKKIISKMKNVGKAHPVIPSRVRGPHLASTKKQLTFRLNRAVVDYFKLQGKGVGKEESTAFSLIIRIHIKIQTPARSKSLHWRSVN